MKEFIERAHEARNKAWEEAKALLDAAGSENRDLDASEQESFDRLNADIDARDARIKELLSVEEREAKAAEARQRFDELSREAPAEARQIVEARQSDNDTLRKIMAGELRGASFKGEARDLTVGSATGGGNTVPTSFRAQLLEHMIETSAIRQTRASVLTTTSGEDIQFPKTTAHSTAALIGEGSPITESDPAFGQVTLGSYKYALIVQTSRELLDDSAVDLVGYLARQAGRAIGNASGAHFATGTGSAQPNGIVTAASLGKTGGTGNVGVPTTDELLDLYYSVIAPYRRNGEWQMSDVTAKEIRKLKDLDGQYVWAPGLLAGEPDSLLGRPVIINTDIADAALSAKSVVFGDHSAYQIRDVNGVDVARSDDFAFNSDLVTWRFLFRTDGDLLDTSGAVKYFVGGAA